MTFITAADQSIFDLFVRQCAQVAVVALAAGTMALVVRRRRPHLAYALWGLVLVKALTPPVWNSPTSLFGWIESSWRVTADSGDGRSPEESREFASLAVPEGERGRLGEGESDGFYRGDSVSAASMSVTAVAEASRGATISDYVLSVWWLGAVLTGGFLVATYARSCRRLRRTAVAAARELRDLTADVARRLGMKCVPEVLLTDSYGPAVCGAIRPQILLPKSLVCEMSPEQMQTILAHELIHVRRGDLYVAWFQTLAQCVWWFHPLVWWASRSMSRERERCCDLELISANLCAREDYAQCLVDTLRFQRSARLGLVPVGLTAFAVTRERLEEIMRATGVALVRSRRTALAIVVLAGVAVLPGGSILQPPTSEETGQKTTAAQAVAAKDERTLDTGAPATTTNPAQATRRTMRVQVVGPDGKPLPGAKVHVGLWTKEPFKANRDFVCDAQGVTTVELPQSIRILRLWVGMDGHVGMFTQWWPEQEPEKREIPSEFSIRLPQGTRVGGIVRNGRGEPIEGVRVEVRLAGESHTDAEKYAPVPNTWLAEASPTHGNSPRITDAQGRWTLDTVPAGAGVEIQTMLTHPDYVSEHSWGDLQTKQGVRPQAFREQTATIVMPDGISLRGFVIGRDGKKIAGALVVRGLDPYLEWGSQEVRTDANGHYRLPPLPAGDLKVTAVAPGWAPDQKQFKLSPDNSSLNFQLKPGQALRIQVLDSQFKPVPKVNVGIHRWRGNQALYNHDHPNVLASGIPRVTDDQGVYEWTWAPDDPVIFRFYKEGYRELESQPLEAGPREHAVYLMPAMPGEPDGAGVPLPAATSEVARAGRKMRIRVLGPDGKPLPGTKVFANVTSNDQKPRIINHLHVTGADGSTTFDLPKTTTVMRLWANCEGHVGMFANWEAEWQEDGHLVPDDYAFRLDKGTQIGGVVKNDDGRPIKGVRVEVQLREAGDSQDVRLCYDRWLSEEYPKGGKQAATTDAQGRWSINNVPPGDDGDVLLKLSHPDYVVDGWNTLQKEQGIALSALRDRSATIVMHRGIELSGFIVDAAGRKVPGAVVVRRGDSEQERQVVRADEKGHYRLPQLRPGLQRITAFAAGLAPQVKEIELSAGNSSLSFQLGAGKRLRPRFVDQDDQPIPKVSVVINDWREGKALFNGTDPNGVSSGIPSRADETGVFEWTSAPDDVVEYVCYKDGFTLILARAKAGEEEQVLKLNRAPKKTP